MPGGCPEQWICFAASPWRVRGGMEPQWSSTYLLAVIPAVVDTARVLKPIHGCERSQGEICVLDSTKTAFADAFRPPRYWVRGRSRKPSL